MKISRRDFLITAAFAGGALHLSREWNFPVAASDRVRVGVISGVGNSSELARYSAIPGTEVVAVSHPSIGATRPRTSLRALAQGFFNFDKQPVVYADWRALIDRPDIDALFLSAAGPAQKEIAIAAFDAGKHVLLEQPGRSVDQLGTISDVAESKHRLAAHSYGAQFIGVSDARSEVVSSVQGLTTARAQHSISVSAGTVNVSDVSAQRREFLLNPVAEFDYARGVLGVAVPSSISCVAMREPNTGAITRAALRFEFGADRESKAIEIDVAGHPGERNPSIVFAGMGSGFAVQSIDNPIFTLAAWSNFVDCVRSKRAVDLVAPVSELRDSLALLQLADESCASGRTLFLDARESAS